jgi:SAM-dependent methyltransferase
MSRIDQWKYEKCYGELETYAMGFGRRQIVQQDIVSMNPGSTYLDVGCGRGETLHLAQQHGVSATGVEIVPQLIAENIIDADIEELPFDDNAFDYVSCYDVLEHLEPGTEQKALDELFRVCKVELFLTTNKKPSFFTEEDGTKLDLHINKREKDEWQSDIMARMNGGQIFFKTYQLEEWHWRVLMA